MSLSVRALPQSLSHTVSRRHTTVLEDFFENLLALADHNLEPADEVVEPLTPSRILDDVMDIELVSSTNPSSRSSQVHHRVV
jgi:hypothetical protein